MLGQRGEHYCVAKEFDRAARYLAGFDFESCQLTWSLIRQEAKVMTYKQAQGVAGKIPGAFVCRALVQRPPQTELALW